MGGRDTLSDNSVNYGKLWYFTAAFGAWGLWTRTGTIVASLVYLAFSIILVYTCTRVLV